MDKIYSRIRIKFPIYKKITLKKGEVKAKKIKKLVLIIFIGILTSYFIIKTINPMFNSICKDKAKAIATEIINVESNKVFKDINYDDLVGIVKDNSSNIKMLRVNTIKVNSIASDLAYKIQQELYNAENSCIKIPIRFNFW